MKAEIISIGTELLLGEITDTDASYLAGQLPLLGIDLYWVSQVGDNRARLVEVLKRAWQRSELILTTGGLGPTGDDLTREAIAEMLEEKSEIDPTLEKHLRERFSRLGMNMPLSNLRQATLIPSARSISNTRGSAPGWWVEREGRILVALPGPPGELQEMWQKEVQPELKQRTKAIIFSKTFKTFGLAEAALGETVSSLLSSTNPTLGVYARADGIHLRLTAKAESQEQADKMIAEGEASIRALLGKYIWGTDGDTLEMLTSNQLIEKGLTLAVMEDYSGGYLAAGFSDIPKSPTFFKGGLVAYSDEAKMGFGVDAEIISQYGASSPEIAQAIAEAARVYLRADIGIGVSGIGETDTGPMGTVYIGIAGSKSGVVINRIGGRQRVVTAALFELRKLLIAPD